MSEEMPALTSRKSYIAGISMLLNRLDPYLKNNYKKKDKGVRYLIKAAIESTGNLWINMYEALEHYGINISLANPLKTRAIAEARIKYDKLDASILADLAGADLISKCYVPDMYIREIRTLIRHRIDLARRRTQLKNKLHTTLDILNSASDTTLRNYIRCFF